MAETKAPKVFSKVGGLVHNYRRRGHPQTPPSPRKDGYLTFDGKEGNEEERNGKTQKGENEVWTRLTEEPSVADKEEGNMDDVRGEDGHDNQQPAAVCSTGQDKKDVRNHR